MAKLSKRIQYICSQVSDDSQIIWDICCDHGQIGAQFLETKKVYFLDKAKSVTQTLKDSHITTSNNIFTNDATEYFFSTSEFKRSFIIAGIGGMLGIRIMANIIPILSSQDEVIISVQSDLLAFKQYLQQQGIGLLSEKVIKENQQFYEVLKLSQAASQSIDPYGSEIWNNSDADTADYLEHLINYYETKSRYSTEFIAILKNYRAKAKIYWQNRTKT